MLLEGPQAGAERLGRGSTAAPVLLEPPDPCFQGLELGGRGGASRRERPLALASAVSCSARASLRAASSACVRANALLRLAQLRQLRLEPLQLFGGGRGSASAFSSVTSSGSASRASSAASRASSPQSALQALFLRAQLAAVVVRARPRARRERPRAAPARLPSGLGSPFGRARRHAGRAPSRAVPARPPAAGPRLPAAACSSDSGGSDDRGRTGAAGESRAARARRPRPRGLRARPGGRRASPAPPSPRRA